MTRHVFIFVGTFAVGALIALAARTARHDPHAGHAAPATVSPTMAPRASPAASSASHAAHGDASAPAAAPATASAAKPVNSVCAICGMNVDPKLPTAEYKGQTIGFGCRMCPPKFKADPDRYGPSYLRNEVIRK